MLFKKSIKIKKFTKNLKKYKNDILKQSKKYYTFNNIYKYKKFFFKKYKIKKENKKIKNYGYKSKKNKKSFFLTEPKFSEIKYPFKLNIRLIK